MGTSFHEAAYFVLADSNGLASWHGFPDITHIKVNNGHKSESAILNFIELKFFRAYPSLKTLILFYSNGLATCRHDFPDTVYNFS